MTTLRVRRPQSEYGGMRTVSWILLVLIVCAAGSRPASAEDAGFSAAAGQLADSSFSVKEEAVGKLVQLRHAGSKPLLAALLDGRVFVRSADQHVFIVKSAEDDPLVLTEPLTQKAAGTGAREEFSKVTT